MSQTLDVTIVLVNFNQSRFFEQAWKSIESQSIKPAQVFVVDDGSQELDMATVKEIIHSHPLSDVMEFFDGQNLGISQRLNKVLPSITTEWFIVLAADDMLLPNSLAQYSSAVTDDVDVLWGDLELMDESGEDLHLARPRDTWQGPIARRYVAGGHPFEDLLKFNNFVPGGMSLIRTDVIRRANGWDADITTEDFDLWLRIGLSSKFTYVAQSVGRYRIVQGSKSRRDSHKLFDQAKFLGKQVGKSPEIDRDVAYLAAMRWAFTIFRTRKLPAASLKQMAEIMALSPWKLRSQLPRAVWVPVSRAIAARVKRLT